MNAEEKLTAIEVLLGGFITRGREPDGESWYTVNDNMYLDTGFFEDMFKILDDPPDR